MRFGTTSYFLGLVKLTENFRTYSTREKKSRVIFCETRLAPSRIKSRKQKPLTRVIIYLFGAFGNQAETYYKKGDYVLVQGRLKLFKRQQKTNHLERSSFYKKEYHLHVMRMSLICRSKNNNINRRSQD
jgi:single-stranded DNA-binding protein